VSELPLSLESAKAIADKVIGETVIPKKVPAVDDIDGQIAAVGAAMADALMTATETPLHVLSPVVGALSAQLVALGIRQTEHVDQAAVNAPTWVIDGMRQESVKLPDPPAHTEAEPFVERTATAPPQPRRISSASRAVRL
jgi:hypothetical protein